MFQEIQSCFHCIPEWIEEASHKFGAVHRPTMALFSLDSAVLLLLWTILGANDTLGFLFLKVPYYGTNPSSSMVFDAKPQRLSDNVEGVVYVNDKVIRTFSSSLLLSSHNKFYLINLNHL